MSEYCLLTSGKTFHICMTFDHHFLCLTFYDLFTNFGTELKDYFFNNNSVVSIYKFRNMEMMETSKGNHQSTTHKVQPMLEPDQYPQGTFLNQQCRPRPLTATEFVSKNCEVAMTKDFPQLTGREFLRSVRHKPSSWEQLQQSSIPTRIIQKQ